MGYTTFRHWIRSDFDSVIYIGVAFGVRHLVQQRAFAVVGKSSTLGVGEVKRKNERTRSDNQIMRGLPFPNCPARPVHKWLQLCVCVCGGKSYENYQY